MDPLKMKNHRNNENHRLHHHPVAGHGKSLGLAAVLLFAMLTLPLAGVGCAPKYIGDSKIANNQVNREIFDLVEQYRQAMETRDVATLKSLMSIRYYENASSTATTEDDWGYPDSDPIFDQLENKVKSVTYNIKITRLELDGPRANVYFDYIWSYLYNDGERDRWGKKSDVNRLELIMEDDIWKILSGM